jgi:hypothetical protein
MAGKEQLHQLIEQLPHEEIIAPEAPVDPEMLARIDAARAHPSPGIPHAETLRDFGL